MGKSSKLETSQRKKWRKKVKLHLYPPVVTCDPMLSVTLRYDAASTASTVWYVGDLIDSILMGATTTNAYPLATTVKLKRIEVWGAGTASETLMLEYNTSSSSTSPVTSRNVSFVDTSSGTARPAHICAKPALHSLASHWLRKIPAQNDELFTVTAPDGATMDITFTIVIGGNENAGAAVTLSSVTAGKIYMHSPSANWTPVAWNSI